MIGEELSPRQERIFREEVGDDLANKWINRDEKTIFTDDEGDRIWTARVLIGQIKPQKIAEQLARNKIKNPRQNTKPKSNNLTQGNTTLLWAEQLIAIIPTYFDKNQFWWVWNEKKHRYETTDETEVLNSLRIGVEVGENTIVRRAQMLEAVKQVSREFEPETPSKEWVQMGDTLYNIQTQEEKKVTPQYFATNPIPWSPAETDETPGMDKLFTEWVGKEYVQTLYEIIAFCTISDYPLHRFIVLTGSGLNGKSKFLEVLETFIGFENTTSIDLDAITDAHSRFEKSNLYRKLLCVVGETNYGRMNKTGILKDLTGGGLISFEFKNKPAFQARNYAKIVMATNSLPPTTDRTTGFYRRALVIDFPNTFKENPRLLDRIPKEEYNALARKCLKIIPQLLENREFHNEGSIEERKRKYEDVSNPLQRFIREETVRDPNGHIYKFEFRDKFVAWQTANGYRVWTDRAVSLAMKEEFEDQKLTVPDSEKRWYAWVGLRWKQFDASGGVQDVQDVQDGVLTPYAYETKYSMVDKLDKLDRAPEKAEFDSVLSDDNIVGLIRLSKEKTGNFMSAEQLAKYPLGSYEERISRLKSEGRIFEPKPGYLGVLE